MCSLAATFVLSHSHVQLIDFSLGLLVNNAASGQHVADCAENDDFQDRACGDLDKLPDGRARRAMWACKRRWLLDE